ncbi:MAG: MFS transporter, partial [Candidatus Saccharibacteria bacterium]
MRYKDFFLVASGHFAVDFYLNFVPALLPVMALKLHLSLAQAGLVATGTALTANFLQPVFGHIFDNRPNRNWLFFALIVSGLCMCFAGMVNSYWLLLLLPALSGLGNGIFHPVGSVVAYQVDKDNKGMLIALFSTFGALGYGLSPGVVAYFINQWGNASLLWMLIPVPILLWAFRGVKLDTQAEYLGPSNKTPILEAIMPGAVILLTVIMVLRAWGALDYVNYLTFFLQERGYQYVTAARILTYFGVLGAAGGILSGFLSDVFGRKRIVVVTLAASALFSAAFLLTEGTLSIVMLLFSGIATAASLPVMVVLGQELMPNNIGLSSGISMGLAWGIGGLGVYINGIVADKYGMVSCFWLATAT